MTIPDECIIKGLGDYGSAGLKGGRYLLTPKFYSRESLVKSSFIPVFWSPVHFPSEAPVGFMIDSKHPVLADFPTEQYADYQWKELVDHSLSVREKETARPIQSILEFVPNFADDEPKSPLFTYTDGNAEFLYCGFDLERNDLATKALKKSILKYLS